MTTVPLADAKTRLNELVDDVASTQERIVITCMAAQAHAKALVDSFPPVPPEVVERVRRIIGPRSPGGGGALGGRS